MRRALYYDILQYQPENLARLADCFDLEIRESPAEDDARTLAAIDLCFAPLGYMFDQAKIGQCKNLKVIASNTTGVPHIDTAAAARRGIAVVSLKDDSEFLARITPTAEHTVGLMLALTRRIPWAQEAALAGRWDRRPFGAAAMLSRLSLGVVGLGRLGGMVAKIGAAFGMTVRYVDHTDKSEDFARCADLRALFAVSDIVSLHVPANDATRAMVGPAELAALKPGACLINTARGELIDEAALLEALQSGKLAGAALDVLDGEFDPGFDARRHPLIQYARSHDNLVITPHIGGSTRDAWAATERRVIERAIEIFAGRDRC